jgi:Patatin-like phospholipase
MQGQAATTDPVGSAPGPGAREFLDILGDEFAELHPDVAYTGHSLADLYAAIHQLDRPQSALCLSGGGIRSASFALGVLQALGRHGLLFGFHYLSTVSGGGYIGSWLSAWRRHAGDDRAVLRSLTTRTVDPADEVPELRALRASSNYLTPRKGAMSPDTWTAVALVVRNLVLNWTVFLPLFLAIILVPIGAAEFVGWSPLWGSPWPQLCLALAAALLVWALAQSLANRAGADGQGIDQGRFLRQILIPQYLAATLLAAVALHPLLGASPRSLGSWLAYGAGAGAVIYGVSWWIAFFWRPTAFGRFAALGTEKDPVPALQLLLYWIVTGAVAGAVLALGYELWLATRGAEDYRAWIGKARVKDVLVVAGVGWAMFALLLGDTLYVGLASYARDGDAEREWRARSSGWIVVATLVWLVLAGVVLFGPQVLDSAWHFGFVAAGGTVSGLIAVLMGSSAKSAATTARQAIERLPVTVTVSIATLVFLPLLAILLAGGARHALDAIEQNLSPDDYRYFLRPDLRLLVTAIACLGCFVAALAMSWFINVNRFSLHAVYRNRLTRGFLGSARTTRPDADSFTGFDLEDNLPMAQLWPPNPNASSHCLFPIINATLNVVATTNLAWQERKAESFSISPFACGNPTVKYRPTASYGGPKGGITLGTAMAISGASLSPNQGYNSSPLVSLLMMLGNVRLGWWLGNPRDDRTSVREGPLFSFIPIINEMFGLTTDRGKYVYLSDGGHFENLGIYEMVRRRCRYIVVSDADCDPDCQFEDLGNAVRKAWIDLGIAIRFRSINVTARKPEPVDGVYCAIAEISYPEPNAKPGLLLYIKPGYHGTEPADVRSYAALHPAFPHESTAEQWFSESQMEAYRVLGSHIVDLVCAGGRVVAGAEPAVQSDLQLSLCRFFDQAAAYLKSYAPNK